MKVLILAGGLGARLEDETANKPKPMVEVGGKPIIWHIMKSYAHDGITDFVILVGYKAEVIQEQFNYFVEPEWTVKVLNTGEGTLKSQRIMQAREIVGEDEHFFVAYGDDLSDLNPMDVYREHIKHPQRIATLTAIPLTSNYGIVEINAEDDSVSCFKEKPTLDGYWINGGYFCFSKAIFDYLEDDSLELEDDVFKLLAKASLIGVYRHAGFWKSMNTKKDRIELEELVQINEAKWMKW